MNFEEMSKIDVRMHVEKKGQFSFLSWPFAVSEFRKACPNGIWEIKHFAPPELLFEHPYCITDSGCFVEVTVIPDTEKPTVRFTQIHPVLDCKNKTVKEPDAFQINTSIQRCLVKAIALATGIGLFIYAGEDLPGADEGKKPFEEYELELEAAFKEGTSSKWWADNNKQAKKDWPKDFTSLVQLKDVLK